jgi:hypothetical protein
MKKYYLPLVVIVLISSAFIYQHGDGGKPWQNKPQQIPGRLECEFYNTGGEGVAYHDSDSSNNGSGKLNPANGTFLNEFRMREGVDISYTKTGNIDVTPYDKTNRDLNQFYVGWTKPGEWINYTININKMGKYQIGVLYTANGNGAISLDVDGRDATGPLKIATTHDDRDTVAWRQWHHWNKDAAIGSINLIKGVHLLTIHIVANGEMNLDYLEFKEEK